MQKLPTHIYYCEFVLG